MKTSLDCMVCFIRQARATGKLATEDLEIRCRLIEQAGGFLKTVDLDRSPPENAVALYAMFARELQTADPFARVKQESNALALSLKQDIAVRIGTASDPLRAAVRAAIGGNIIDYAAQHVFDARETMATCFDREFVLDDYPSLHKAVSVPNAKVLYLCDNCGEIVFDGLLIEQLKECGCRVTAAVREQPIINDATMEDALFCGLERICPVISNGTACPGTPLESCSEEFKEEFRQADIIISKGMGNFETLSEVQAPIFFLFTVKCSEVARHVTVRHKLSSGTLTGNGEMILMQQNWKKYQI